MKIYDSELKVMNVLWNMGDSYASQIACQLGDDWGWNRNTTYTIIKKLILKGAVERVEPKFFCRALVSRQHVQQVEMDELVDRLFEGRREAFVEAVLSRYGQAGQQERLQA